jgi:hypothetical protein
MCPLLCRFAVLFATMMVMHPARLQKSSKQRSQGCVRELNMASRFELRQPTDGENSAQPCLKLQVRYWEQVSNRPQVKFCWLETVSSTSDPVGVLFCIICD